MIGSLKDQAIQNALQNNWETAVQLNKQILSENASDIETLNRLAFAYMKVGNFKKAKSTYRKVLNLDKSNPIALKNMKKVDTVSKQKKVSSHNSHPVINLQELYIEEAGKTKTLELKNLTDKKTISLLQPGDMVNLVIKRSKIFVQTNDDAYIGMLPEDIGTRLITFIKGGNQYIACLKAIGDKSVTIFIKEMKKSSRFKNQPSFPTSYSHVSGDE